MRCWLGSNYDVINGINVDDEFSEVDEKTYIKPNELAPYLFHPVLKNRTGILLAVGTIRALVAFSLGNLDYLVMLDVNKATREHNRETLHFIQSLVKKYPKDSNAQRNEFASSRIRQKNFLIEIIFGVTILHGKKLPRH